jgi:FixJ family two-component response regulator
VLKESQVYELLHEHGVVRTIRQARRLQEEQRANAGYVGKRIGELPAEVAEQVLERYAAGEPGVAIAEDLGLAQSSMYRVCWRIAP